MLKTSKYTKFNKLHAMKFATIRNPIFQYITDVTRIVIGIFIKVGSKTCRYCQARECDSDLYIRQSPQFHHSSLDFLYLHEFLPLTFFSWLSCVERGLRQLSLPIARGLWAGICKEPCLWTLSWNSCLMVDLYGKRKPCIYSKMLHLKILILYINSLWS